MRFSKFLAAASAVVLSTSLPALADVVVSSGTGMFVGPVTPTKIGGNQNPGDPNNLRGNGYWDHGSSDANNGNSKCNVGWVVNGDASGCSNDSSPASGFGKDDPEPNSYWAKSDGSYDPSFFFKNTAFADGTELELTITGDGSDAFGWYDTADPTNRHPLFKVGDKSETMGANITSANFGFYMTSGSGTFYTQSELNTADLNVQHFAVFRVHPDNDSATANRYFIGTEDAVKGDYDYNDMIVDVFQTSTAIPEPSAVVLFGTMVLGCAAFYRKRFAK